MVSPDVHEGRWRVDCNPETKVITLIIRIPGESTVHAEFSALQACDLVEALAEAALILNQRSSGN